MLLSVVIPGLTTVFDVAILTTRTMVYSWGSILNRSNRRNCKIQLCVQWEWIKTIAEFKREGYLV